jgi:tight adherence protein C
MPLHILLSLIFVSTCTIILLVLSLFGKKSDPVVKRMKDVVHNEAELQERREIIVKMDSSDDEKPSFGERIASIFSAFSKQDKQRYSRQKLQMLQAGYYHENSIRIYNSLRILGFIGLLSLSTIPWILMANQVPQPLLIALLLPMPFMGYAIPGIILKGKIRRRQADIAQGLPDALDFLVVCVEAGLGLNSALVRVGQELRLKCSALGEELILVNQEMRAGVSREEALRNLTIRNPIEDLRILVGSLILADKLGSSITNTLRVQADSLRTRVRQRTEELAAQAGIKMLFPLVFLILPALFIVIMGPGAILTLQAMVD